MGLMLIKARKTILRTRDIVEEISVYMRSVGKKGFVEVDFEFVANGLEEALDMLDGVRKERVEKGKR